MKTLWIITLAFVTLNSYAQIDVKIAQIDVKISKVSDSIDLVEQEIEDIRVKDSELQQLSNNLTASIELIYPKLCQFNDSIKRVKRSIKGNLTEEIHKLNLLNEKIEYEQRGIPLFNTKKYVGTNYIVSTNDVYGYNEKHSQCIIPIGVYKIQGYDDENRTSKWFSRYPLSYSELMLTLESGKDRWYIREYVDSRHKERFESYVEFVKTNNEKIINSHALELEELKSNIKLLEESLSSINEDCPYRKSIDSLNSIKKNLSDGQASLSARKRKLFDDRDRLGYLLGFLDARKTELEYDKRSEIERQAARAIVISQKREYDKWSEIERIKKAKLISKYGEKIGTKIYLNEYFVGMTQAQFNDCTVKGTLVHQSSSTKIYKIESFFTGTRYLVFKKNKLTSITDHVFINYE